MDSVFIEKLFEFIGKSGASATLYSTVALTVLGGYI